jgi:transposase
MRQTLPPPVGAVTIGVDISKQRLDVHALPERVSRDFPNDKAGIAALIGWATPLRPNRILFEATGAYHRGLETALGEAALPAVKLNPWRVRRFAEATGQRAKTDPIDAALIARFGTSLCPAIPPARDTCLDQIKELLSARRALIKDRTAARQRGMVRSLSLLARQGKERLRQISAQIKAIDRACLALIEADPALRARFAILTSIPGVGPVLAITLLAEMAELGTIEAKAAASLAGLAPVTRQSGQWSGKSFIGGGRKPVRDALYMPALVAARFNPALKAGYEAMIRAGKPAKLAIVAVMRKLLVLANALLRDGRRWTAEPVAREA